jgi:hypothetical protein
MQTRSEVARVVITVKATPQPSAKYGDTVCVAGIRVDGGRAEWIRLYPVPFRWLEREAQFHKYDVVDLDVRRRTADSRPESFVPDRESIRVVGRLGNWKARQHIFDQLPRTTTCALRGEAAARHGAPSLGMVPVARLHRVRITPHGGWTEAELDRIARGLATTRDALFAPQGEVPPRLRAPRFVVRYEYFCLEAGCGGHTGQNLDWELTAFQNRARQPDAQLEHAIRDRFATLMFAPDRATSLFMGNFEDPKKRQNFSVLGVHYPRRTIASATALFPLDGDGLAPTS